MKNKPKFLAVTTLIFASAIGLTLATGAIADDGEFSRSKNIIAKVVSAPVVSNGLVANKPTEFNIIFSPRKTRPGMELDPDKFGYQIPMGGRLELELSGSFMRNKDMEGNPVVSPIVANRNIIMTTGPQNPIVAAQSSGVQHGNWSVTDDGHNLITITPNDGMGKRGLENARANKIGFKIIHLRPNPSSGSGPAVFWNGAPGSTGTVAVRIYNKYNRLIASGYKDVIFDAEIGRQVHISNAGLTTGAQGNPATMDAELIELTQFLKVAPDTMLTNTTKTIPFSAGAPYAPRFLLFENANAQADDFIPQSGIEGVDYMVDMDRPWTAKLMQADEVIGAITIQGPAMKSRGMILASTGPTSAGGNGSVLNVPVKVGSMKGLYKVSVTLLGGNSATNIIKVIEEDD